jgi:cell division protein FtsB
MDHFERQRLENRLSELEVHKGAISTELPALSESVEKVLADLSNFKVAYESQEARIENLRQDQEKTESLKAQISQLEAFRDIQEQKNKDFLYYIGFREKPWTKKRVAYFIAWGLASFLYLSALGATTGLIFVKIVK